MGEEVPCIFNDEEEGDLAQHCFQLRERNLVRCEAEVLCDGVEKPNLFHTLALENSQEKEHENALEGARW